MEKIDSRSMWAAGLPTCGKPWLNAIQGSQMQSLEVTQKFAKKQLNWIEIQKQ